MQTDPDHGEHGAIERFIVTNCPHCYPSYHPRVTLTHAQAVAFATAVCFTCTGGQVAAFPAAE
jgi:hypothetical protein